MEGDTTTAFIGALAAYYKQIKVAHIQAELRSQNIYSPFPEEANRKFISTITHYHVEPTQQAKDNLLNENIPKENIIIVGNPVIDALLIGIKKIEKNKKPNRIPHTLKSKHKKGYVPLKKVRIYHFN